MNLCAPGRPKVPLVRRHLIGGALERWHQIEHVPAPVVGDLDESALRAMFLDVPSGEKH